MKLPGRDPLLAAVRVLVTAIMAVTALSGAALLVAVVAMPLWWAHAAAAIVRHLVPAIPADIPYMIGAVMALVAAVSFLATLFLLLLRRIIDTVAHGDPFIPLNAERLARMGWTSVAIQLCALPADVLSNLIARALRIPPAEVGWSVGGILMALVLFVLARVFREGTKMREELEGTV